MIDQLEDKKLSFTSYLDALRELERLVGKKFPEAGRKERFEEARARAYNKTTGPASVLPFDSTYIEAIIEEIKAI